jgi:hypothetical protein
MHLKKIEPIQRTQRHAAAALTGMPAYVFVNDPGVFLRSLILRSGSQNGGWGDWAEIPIHPDRAALCTDGGIFFLIDLGKNMDPGGWVDPVWDSLPGARHTHRVGASVDLPSFFFRIVDSGWTTDGTVRGALLRVDLCEMMHSTPCQYFPMRFPPMRPVLSDPLNAVTL